jgi:hypothetical protein
MSYTPTMFLSILPEILILVLGVLLLVLEPFWKDDQHRNAGDHGDQLACGSSC